MCKIIRTCGCTWISLLTNLMIFIWFGDVFLLWLLSACRVGSQVDIKISKASGNPILSNTFQQFRLWPFACPSLRDPVSYYRYWDCPSQHILPSPRVGRGLQKWIARASLNYLNQIFKNSEFLLPLQICQTGDRIKQRNWNLFIVIYTLILNIIAYWAV